jgi:DNA-binding HxlR family transcriptional regulator
MRKLKATFLEKELEDLPRPNLMDSHCPARKTLEIIADKWIALVIVELMNGTYRHNHLKKKIGGISQKMLTQTLRQLEYNGLVTRTVYPTVPVKVEYSLTPLGRSLGKVIYTLGKWTMDHMHEVIQARLDMEASNPELKSVLRTLPVKTQRT